jgi:hypothetical protein
VGCPGLYSYAGLIRMKAGLKSGNCEKDMALAEEDLAGAHL